MAMTPIEMIEFCDSQVNGGIQRGLEKGKANGDYYLIALNYDEGFKCRLRLKSKIKRIRQNNGL